MVLGDFSSANPTQASVDAVADVIGWKFARHQLDVRGSTQFTSLGGPRYESGTVIQLPKIVSHRDVGQTSCPGSALYTRLGEIRTKAAAHFDRYITEQPMTPLFGDFDGDGRRDVLRYRPGTAADVLWSRPAEGIRRSALTIDGTYRPVVADLDGDGRDDIFWYAPGSYPGDRIWFGGPAGFTSRVVDVPEHGITKRVELDGDGRDDIVVYAPGPSPDRIYSGGPGQTVEALALAVDGTFELLAGDFDGDRRDDLFWYGAGSRADHRWFSNGQGSFTPVPTRVDGTFDPVVGDFDGNGHDDVLWYAPGEAADALWWSEPGRAGRSPSPHRGSGVPATSPRWVTSTATAPTTSCGTSPARAPIPSGCGARCACRPTGSSGWVVTTSPISAPTHPTGSTTWRGSPLAAPATSGWRRAAGRSGPSRSADRRTEGSWRRRYAAGGDEEDRMQRLGRFDGARRHVVRRLALVVVLVVPCAAAAVASPLPAGAQELPETITFTGRGWGHGRGLGQWGAFGYATGRSGGPWDHSRILSHFYGDTQPGDIANPLAAVALLNQRGKPLAVERAAGVTVDGQDGSSVAVRATLRPDGRFDVQRAGGCAGPWSPAVVVDGIVRLRAPGTTGAAADALQLCRDDGTRRGYRGELVAMARSFDGHEPGVAQTVNLLRLDDLLRSVVPNLLPPAWGQVDERRGMHALMAQAVASRGFAAMGDGRWRDLHSGIGASFTTCDAAACQPYTGVAAEDPVTDEAIRSTTGEVRMRAGVLIRTEYTASTGGWTAGGAFPAVADIGDAVLANPNQEWTTFVDRAAIESQYGLGRLQAITILERNGLGAEGGRVRRMALVGTARTVEITGAEARSAFGLRSDWFTVSGAPPRPAVEPRDIDDACPPGEVPEAGYRDVDRSDVHAPAIDCATWWRVAQGATATAFRPAGEVTRGQMASFVARLLEASGGHLPQGEDAFADDEGSVHEPEIDALAQLGIVRGVEPGRFDPSGAVGRAQAASLVARGLTWLGIRLTPDPPDAFADDSGSVHEPALDALAADGIVTGVSAGRVNPTQSIRRDQVASLLARTLDLVVERTAVAHP